MLDVITHRGCGAARVWLHVKGYLYAEGMCKVEQCGHNLVGDKMALSVHGVLAPIGDNECANSRHAELVQVEGDDGRVPRCIRVPRVEI